MFPIFNRHYRVPTLPSIPLKSHQNPFLSFASIHLSLSRSICRHIFISEKKRKKERRRNMAQREKEETEFKVPETLILCVNNCGYSGHPATQNMCQKCFQASGIHASPSCSTLDKPKPASIRLFEVEKPVEFIQIRPCESVDPQAPVREVNRCWGCRKKVGLTGFRCRCGDLFCSEHRYSDRHACNYDYKAAGREAIARENPVVKAAKIVRI